MVGLLAASLLGALACCVGCAAGAVGTGSDDAVSMGDFFALPFVAVGALLFLQPAFGTGPWAFAVPILGPALLLREGGSGTLGAADAVLAVASTILWCWLLLRWAGRRLGNEKAITRAIR